MCFFWCVHSLTFTLEKNQDISQNKLSKEIKGVVNLVTEDLTEEKKLITLKNIRKIQNDSLVCKQMLRV